MGTETLTVGEPGGRGKVTCVTDGFPAPPHLQLALTSKSMYIALMATLMPCLVMVFWSFLSICSVVSPKKWTWGQTGAQGPKTRKVRTPRWVQEEEGLPSRRIEQSSQ